MVNNTRKKQKALKKTANQSGFFRALLFGLLCSAALWIVLALVLSGVMYKQEDSTALIGVFAPVNAAVSLVAGGFAAGKINKSKPFFTALVLGCASVGICYVISSVFDFSDDASIPVKTALMIMMILCPVFGARVSRRKKSKRGNARKRM